MTTTAAIAFVHQDETVTSVRVLRDGSPEFLGETLTRSYQSPDKIKELMSRGDLIDLEKFIDKSLYCADDIEDWGDTAPRTYKNLSAFFMAHMHDYNYLYIYRNGKWYCHDCQL